MLDPFLWKCRRRSTTLDQLPSRVGKVNTFKAPEMHLYFDPDVWGGCLTIIFVGSFPYFKFLTKTNGKMRWKSVAGQDWPVTSCFGRLPALIDSTHLLYGSNRIISSQLWMKRKFPNCPVKQENKVGTTRKAKQQGTLFSFMKETPVAKMSSNSSCLSEGQSVPGQKRTAVAAKLSMVALSDICRMQTADCRLQTTDYRLQQGNSDRPRIILKRRWLRIAGRKSWRPDRA